MKKMVKTLACVLTTAALLFAVTGCPKTTDDETPETTTKNHYLQLTIPAGDQKPIIRINTANGDTTVAAERKTIKSISYKILVPTTNQGLKKVAVTGKHLYPSDTWMKYEDKTLSADGAVISDNEWNCYVKYDENNDEPEQGKWVTKEQSFIDKTLVSGYSCISGYWESGATARTALTDDILKQSWRWISLEGYEDPIASDTEYMNVDDIIITYGDDSTKKYDMEDASSISNFKADSDGGKTNTIAIVEEE